MDEIERALKRSINRLLQRHNLTGDAGGAADERWYWAAPLLLDVNEDPALTRAWWAQENLATLWTGATRRGGLFSLGSPC